MQSELVLLTKADATLPADGAILVTHRDVLMNGPLARGARWVVNDGSGAKVEITVEDLGSAIERWIPKTPADRDLVIRDEAGTLVATLHQTAAPSKGQLAAPKVRSFTSTTRLDANVGGGEGVAGASTKLELVQDPPTGTRFLAIAITNGADSYAQSALVPTAAKRKFEATTYAHKSCARGGPTPVFIGQHVALSWIDELGRRSTSTKVTVQKQ
jgi:hypothetical protein